MSLAILAASLFHSPRLDDLAIVCSNCHRMIHRTKPMMSVEGFRDKYKPRSGFD